MGRKRDARAILGELPCSTQHAATQATSSSTQGYAHSIPSHLCPAARADRRRRTCLTGRARPTAHGHITLCVSDTRPSRDAEASISVLGPFRVSGARRALKRAATRELIAYLALQPKGASRDELIEALWPAQDPERTRPRFWQSVTDARGALADAWLHDGERYQLDRAKVNIDLDQLEQLLASTDPEHDDPKALETAIGLWRGEPLEGTDYAWADGHIRRLRATLLELLERTGHSRLQSGDARGALEWPSKQSRSTSSTRQAGASRSTPNTRSGCASRSRGATTHSHAPSMNNSALSPHARQG